MSTALLEYAPATFKKNSCLLLVPFHPLTLHIIFVVTSTFTLMYQLVMVINLIFLDLYNLKHLASQPTHLYGHILDLILSPSDHDTIIDVKICDLYLIIH